MYTKTTNTYNELILLAKLVTNEKQMVQTIRGLRKLPFPSNCPFSFALVFVVIAGLIQEDCAHGGKISVRSFGFRLPVIISEVFHINFRATGLNSRQVMAPSSYNCHLYGR
jgi:hypothetical protein